MSQWASIFVETSLSVSKATGDLLGPAAFAVMMGVGRLIYGIAGRRQNMIHAMMLSSIACLFAYLLTLLPGRIIPILGCSLVGLGVSFMWPAILSLAANAFPSSGTGMFALLAMFGDIGGSLGPWFAGIIADHSPAGLTAGLMTGPCFAVILFLSLLKYHKRASLSA